ncbi:MAG: hypothetical protein NTX25_03630 [Proteobacteria bacterium]|nr:hypothetical protein [Pseudomonadota bacterium]
MDTLCHIKSFSLVKTVLFLSFIYSNHAFSECKNKDIGFFDVDDNCACDLKAKPWLDASCGRVNPYNPDHACRLASYIDHHGGNASNPELYSDLHVWQLPGESIFDLAVKTCESVKKSQCMEYELFRTKMYRSAISPFLDDAIGELGLSTTNIHRNFLNFSKKSDQIIEQIDHISDAMLIKLEGINSREDAKIAVAFFYDEMKPVQFMMKELTETERILDINLKIITEKTGLIELNTGILKHQLECKKYLSGIEQPYNTEIKELFKMMNTYREKVVTIRNNTNKLYNAAYESWTFAPIKKYADVIGKQIVQLSDSLFNDLYLDNLLWQVDDWWTRSTVNGLAGNLHTKYFLYSEPLRILRIEHEEAEKFRDRIRNIRDLNPETLNLALKGLESKMAIIDKNIDFITSKGWQGLLALQKQSALKRASILANNQNCQEITKNFLDQVESVKSVEDFDLLSPLYQQSLTFCVK